MMNQDPQNPGVEPVYHVDVNNKRGILDKSNPELMSGDDSLKILQHYTKVQKTPRKESEIIQQMYDHFRYGFFNQTSSLTFYDKIDKPLYDIDFELCWLSFLMTLPPGSLTQKVRLYKYQLKRYADALFHRSVGTDRSKTNERIAQQMSVLQNVSTSMGGSMSPRGGGQSFLGKIRSLLG